MEVAEATALSILTPSLFPAGSDRKESACNEGDLGSIPGLGKSPRVEHGNSLQYSCLENPHGQRSLEGYSSRDRTERLSTHSSSRRGRRSFCSALETPISHISAFRISSERPLLLRGTLLLLRARAHPPPLFRGSHVSEHSSGTYTSQILTSQALHSYFKPPFIFRPSLAFQNPINSPPPQSAETLSPRSLLSELVRPSA